MKTIWVLFLCVSGLMASAQVASECEENFKTFEEKVKARDYDDAYALLADLRKKCPKHNEKLYAYSDAVLKYFIEVTNEPVQKQIYIDDLIAAYGEQDINFPGSGGDVKKTLLQLDHKKISNDEAYKALNASFKKNRKSFTDYTALQTYFMLFLEQYKAGKGVTDEQFIEKYGEIASQIASAKNKTSDNRDAMLKKQETQMLNDEERQLLADAEPEIDALEGTGENITKLASAHLSCEKMEVYYSNNYEAHKTDTAWLDGLVMALYDKKCYNSPVLYKGAQALHAIKPTAQSAYRLGMLSLKRQNIKEGVAYYEQSASLEPGVDRKAAIYYEIASAFRNLDKAESKKYALRSAELNPKSGKPYLLLAEMYSSGTKECGANDFERKALVWLAMDAAKKAENAEPKYKATVAKLMEGYNKKKPSKEEAKAAGKKKGDTVAYGCWINETVTVPNL